MNARIRMLGYVRSHVPATDIRSRRSMVPGLAGFGLGVVLTLAGLALLAPRPAAANAASGRAELGIVMDDAYLSQMAARGLAGAQLPFDLGNVRAHATRGNQVEVTADADLLLGTAQLTATAQLAVTGGRLAVHTTDAELGGLALPDLITGMIDNAINQQLGHASQAMIPRGSPYALDGVTTTDGSLTLLIAQK